MVSPTPGWGGSPIKVANLTHRVEIKKFTNGIVPMTMDLQPLIFYFLLSKIRLDAQTMVVQC